MYGAKETRPCGGCGKELTRLLSQTKAERWFCSVECRVAHIPLPVSVKALSNPLSGQEETRPCAQCETPLTRRLTLKRVKQTWFCSGHCRAIHQTARLMAEGRWVGPRKPRTGDTLSCDVCGTEFYRGPAAIKDNRRFCSPQCGYSALRKQRVLKQCAHCGSEMRLRPSAHARIYCSKSCEARSKIVFPTGREHNGRPVVRNAHGYLSIYEPAHPAASRSGRVLEHRWIMEQHLGRLLLTKEQVNHVNHDPKDNRLENLEILTPDAHTRETVAWTMKRHKTAEDRLAEYERRFGPLD